MEEPFKPHPNLSDDINRNIMESQILGGVYVKDLPLLTVLSVQTRQRTYTLVREAEGWYVSGHPEYCPEPVLCGINGSTWGGSMLRLGFVGRGMYLELILPSGHTLTTSEIIEVTEVK